MRGPSVSESAGRTLSAEELARDVDSLAADDDNLLAVQELLGHDRGQTAKQVALAVDNNLLETQLRVLVPRVHTGGTESRAAQDQNRTYHRLEGRHRSWSGGGGEDVGDGGGRRSSTGGLKSN